MDFTQPWDFGDVTFIVEDKKIYMNKGALAMSSEVFRAMFLSDFAEKKMTEIPLPDKKFDDFLQLMQLMQPLSDTCVDDTNVESLLPLAHEYQIHQVVERCEKVLLAQPPSIHNLLLADKFSLTELRKACIQYVKDTPYNKLENDPEFKGVDKNIVWEALQQKLELHEGKDPLKNIISKLVSEPPSIKNLLLAEKCDVPEPYNKCLTYLKDTPFAQLEHEAGYKELDADILNAVLKHKIRKCETLIREVSKIISTERNDNYYCIDSTHEQHLRGTKTNCAPCRENMIHKICEVIKKYP